jgi:hypothetical protein
LINVTGIVRGIAHRPAAFNLGRGNGCNRGPELAAGGYVSAGKAVKIKRRRIGAADILVDPGRRGQNGQVKRKQGDIAIWTRLESLPISLRAWVTTADSIASAIIFARSIFYTFGLGAGGAFICNHGIEVVIIYNKGAGSRRTGRQEQARDAAGYQRFTDNPNSAFPFPFHGGFTALQFGCEPETSLATVCRVNYSPSIFNGRSDSFGKRPDILEYL